MRVGYRLPGSCFVSGMDAGDEEQLAALAVVHGLRALGLRVAAMTPVATDGVQRAGRWSSPLLDRLGRASSFVLPAAALSPYVLPPAPTPSAAAQRAGTRVEADAVLETYQVLATWADAVVVAGAGGLPAPLGPVLDVHAVARRLALPLLLTLRADAGALDRAGRARALVDAGGVRLAGWLAMGVTADSGPLLAALAAALQAPPLAAVPASVHCGSDAARHLDRTALHRALVLDGGPAGPA